VRNQHRFQNIERPTNSKLIVQFPDVPGALTQVDAGEELDELAHGCLLAALGGYLELRHEPTN